MASRPDRYYTDAERAFLESFIPGHSHDETAAEFGRRFGRELKRQQVRDFARLRGIKSGVNTGKWAKGRRNANELPVGGETVDERGNVHVKVSGERNVGKRDRYRLKSHVEWEKAHGAPVPDGCCVVFADGDKRNLDPANLVAVERRVLNVINGLGLRHHDAETLQACIAVAKVKAKLKDKREEMGA